MNLFRWTAAVALFATSAWAHDVFPSAITLRPGGEDFVYVADQGTCPATITITSTNPAAVTVFAVNMNTGAVLSGGGTSATVADRVDQVFVVRANASLTADAASVLRVCWVGSDFPNAPCNENNCNPFFPHDVAVSVVLNPQTAGALSSASVAGDPVVAVTGEFVMPVRADFDLGGPMPLSFSRLSASRLQSEGNSTSTLGPNWTHNFGWRTVSRGHNVEVISDQGRVIRFERGFFESAWSLSPLNDIPYQLLESGPDLVLADPLDGLRYTFASNGRLSNIQDGRGNTHTLSYAGSNLASVSDGLGRTLTFTHVGSRMTQVSDGTRTVSFGYDGAQRLSTATDAAGKITTYAYASPTSNLIASVTRPEGNVPYSQTYDVNDRVATQTDALGNTWSFSYNTNTDTTTITDPDTATQVHDSNSSGALTSWRDEGGSSATMTNDADGRRTRVTDRLGASSSWTIHAPSGKIASNTEADGRVTQHSYTARLLSGVTLHDLTSISYPDSSSESFSYDAFGNRTSWLDRAGGAWTYTYNARGQVTSVLNPSGGTTASSYNANGTLANTTDPAGNVTIFGYDALRRINLATYADTLTRAYAYDALDHVISVTDEANNVTGFTYDDNGNLETIVDPSTATWTFVYDDLDRLASVLNPLGHTAHATFDALGRVDEIADGSGRSLTLGYDSRGRVNSASKGIGGVWMTTHNLEGVPTGAIDPNGASSSITSNVMGRITSWTSELGHTSTFSYDALGRLKSFGDASGFDWSFDYNGRGEVTKFSSPVAGAFADFTRDGLGRVTQTTLPGGADWSTTFDSFGRATAQIDPLGRTTTYAYDSRNRVQTATFPGALGNVNYEYDVLGKLSRRLYSSGLDLSYTYDPNGRLTDTENVALTYDTAGRITSSNGMALDYDDAGRVIEATLGAGQVVNYAYDARGLCSSLTDWFGGTTQFTYDSAGRMTGIERPNGVDTTFAYDADGNRERIFEFDATNTLSDIQMRFNSRGLLRSMDRATPLTAKPVDHDLSFTLDAAQQIEDWVFDELGRVLLDDGEFWANWDGGSRATFFHEDGEDFWLNWDGLDNFVGWTGGGSVVQFERHFGFPSAPITRHLVDATPRFTYIPLPDGSLFGGFDHLANAGFYLHFDEQGSTNFVTDPGGVVNARFAYDPMGALLTEDNAPGYVLKSHARFGAVTFGSGRFRAENKGLFDTCTLRYLAALSPVAFSLYTARMQAWFDGVELARAPDDSATTLVDQNWLGGLGTLSARFVPKIQGGVRYEYDFTPPEREVVTGVELPPAQQVAIDTRAAFAATDPLTEQLGIDAHAYGASPTNHRQVVQKFRAARAFVSMLRPKPPGTLERQIVLDVVAARLLTSMALSDTYTALMPYFLARGPSELRGAMQDPSSLGMRLRSTPYLTRVPLLNRLFLNPTQRPLLMMLTPTVTRDLEEQ